MIMAAPSPGRPLPEQVGLIQGGIQAGGPGTPAGGGQWRIWLLIAAATVLLFVLFEEILLPFVAGIGIAYLLDPLADRLQRLGLPRGLAALAVLVLFGLIMIAVLLLIVPMLQAQIIELVRRSPEYLAALQKRLLELAELAETRLAPEDVERLRAALTEQAGTAFTWIAAMLREVLGSGLAFFNLLALLFVTPIVAFYLLRDWDRLVAQVDRLLPLAHRATIRRQAALIDATLAGYVRGQASVCVVLGLLYATGLMFAGLDFGFTVGLLSGLVSFIPYVGSIFGLVTSVGLALIQFDEFSRVLIVAGIFIAGQVIEGNILTPKLVGDRVNLHPVWVIFALFAGGALAGFVGMLLALPVAAAMGVLVRFMTERYLVSSLYRGAIQTDVAGTPTGTKPDRS
jgi:predicted PurR-regulated permease PerM